MVTTWKQTGNLLFTAVDRSGYQHHIFQSRDAESFIAYNQRFGFSNSYESIGELCKVIAMHEKAIHHLGYKHEKENSDEST